MTWTFLYLAAVIIGIVLGSVTGLFKDLFFFGRSHRHLVVPKAEQHFPMLSLALERASALFTAFGVGGLVLAATDRFDVGVTLAGASALAIVGGVAAVLLLRRRCPPSRTGARVTAVADIAPGGYGQVLFDEPEGGVRLAAWNADEETIPAGCQVVVIDCERSVVTVTRIAPA